MAVATADSKWTHHRARIAALSRDRTPDDPELVEARRNLRAARLAEHVEKTLAAAPPLTSDQRDTIARLLTASASRTNETPAERDTADTSAMHGGGRVGA